LSLRKPNPFRGKIPFVAGALIALFLVTYASDIRTFFNAFSINVQTYWIDAKESVSTWMTRHIEQAKRIERLEKEVARWQRRTVACRSDAAAYRAMMAALQMQNDFNVSMVPVPALGYVTPGNFQRLWLENFPDYDFRRNYGVVRAGYAVGIVVNEGGRPMMILGGDPSCSFAVYVGSIRAPGIAMGEDPRHMIVRYIPEWMRIAPGDEVITSGLDRIFPIGVPVGRVLSIRRQEGFKVAKIELYGDTLHPNFVWVVRP